MGKSEWTPPGSCSSAFTREKRPHVTGARGIRADLNADPDSKNAATSQLVVTAAATSVPPGIPNLGCGKERNFIPCKQLNCDTAQWRDEHAAMKRPWSEAAQRQAPLRLDSSLRMLCSHDTFSVRVSEFKHKKHTHQLLIKNKRTVSTPRPAGSYRKSLGPWPLIGSSSCK